MRTTLLLIALAFALPCQAMIGMTEKEAIQQLGQPNSRDGSHLFWHIDKLNLAYWFEPGVGVGTEMYTSPRQSNRLSLDDARELVGEETPLANWTEARFIAVDSYFWRSNVDRRAAVFHPKSGVLIITSDVSWIEAETHATGLEWERAMGPRARERR